MATTHVPHIERRHMLDRRQLPDRRSTRDDHAAQAVGMSTLDWVAMAMMIVGGINWGLVGLFGFDLVAFLFGEQSLASRIFYLAVGIAALYSLYLGTKMSRDQT